jgi:serine/threonine protein kinase
MFQSQSPACKNALINSETFEATLKSSAIIEDIVPSEFDLASTLVGVAINRRYRITTLIGAGPTSCLYKGFDRYSELHVLVKVLHPHLVSSQESIAVFERETELISPLLYPGFKRIIDKHVLSTGQLYVVMECDKDT